MHVSLNEGSRPIQRLGENALTIFENLLQNHMANLAKLDTKHSKHNLMKESHVCSNEGPCPFPMGDNERIGASES